MATINGLYIFVTSEELAMGVDVTEHVVENGIDIADHVRRRAYSLSLSGEIVGQNAASVLAQLKKIHNTGEVVRYNGRNAFSNCIITEFNTGHPNTIWGGCEFSMTLKEIRTASSAYKTTTNVKSSTKKTGTQQVSKNSSESWVYHTVKKGDCVWNLVAAKNAPYKGFSRPAINGKKYDACDWVMVKNPNAFSRKGDFRTLQIGKKLIVGKR